MRTTLLLIILSIAPSCAQRRKAEPAVDANKNSNALQTPQAAMLSSPSAQGKYFTLGGLQLAAIFLRNYPGKLYPFQIFQKGKDTPYETGNVLWGSRIFPNLDTGNYNAKVQSCTDSPTDFTGKETTAPTCSPEDDVPLLVSSVEKPNDELLGMARKGVSIADSIRAVAVKLQQALETFRKAVPSDKTQFSQNVDTLINNGPEVNGELLNSPLIPNLYSAVNSKGAMPAISQSSGPTHSQATDPTTQTVAAPNNTQSSSSSASGGTTGGSVLIAVGVSAVILGIIVEGVSFAGDHFAAQAYDKANALGGTLFASDFNAHVASVANVAEGVLTAFTPGAAAAMNQAFKIAENIAGTSLGHNSFVSREILDRFIGTNLREDLKLGTPPAVSFLDSLGEVKYFADGGVVYEAHESLIGNQKNYDHMTEEQQKNFKKMDDGSFQLSDEGKKNYTQVGDTYYRKATPAPDLILKVAGKKPIYYIDMKTGAVKYIVEGEQSQNVFVAAEKFQSLEEGKLTIDKTSFDGLATTLKDHFIESDGGHYTVKPGFKDLYTQVGDTYYRRTGAMAATVLPDLSAETLANLNEAATRMPGKPEYGKGIPLFDPQGRLVEPPAHWKVAGGNWFYEGFTSMVWGRSTRIPADGSFMDVTLHSHEQYRFPKKDGAIFASATMTNPRECYQWTDIAPEKGMGMGIVNNLADVDKIAWNTHLGLLNSAQITKLQIEAAEKAGVAELKKATGMAQAKVDEYQGKAGNLYHENVVKSLRPEEVSKYTETGKMIGGAVILAGVAAVAGGIAMQQLGLAEDPAQQALNDSLNALGKELMDLHKQRSVLGGEINDWLKAHNQTAPANADYLSHF